MIVSAKERRQILKLFNVSEAARLVGMSVNLMHREVRKGNIPAPQVQVGKRFYYTCHDLDELINKYAANEW